MKLISTYKTEEELFKVKEGNLFIFPVGSKREPFAPKFLRKSFGAIYMTYQQQCFSPQNEFMEFMTMDLGQDFIIGLILAIENNQLNIPMWFEHLEKIIKVKDPQNVFFHVNWINLPNFNLELFEYQFEEWAASLTYETKVHFVWNPESEIVQLN